MVTVGTLQMEASGISASISPAIKTNSNREEGIRCISCNMVLLAPSNPSTNISVKKAIRTG